MKIRRTSRIVAALVALFSLLFMQLAVASYSCPVAKELVTASSNCAGLDPAQPSLCKAQATNQAAKQALDKPDAPPVLPFVPQDLAGLVLPADWPSLGPDGLAAPPGWARSVAPPIAITNCCFRN